MAIENLLMSNESQVKISQAVEPGMRKGLTSYGDQGFSLFLRKAFIKGAGYTDRALDRPVIGIANTGSAYNPCHGNAPQLIEAVKRGVMLAGGLPMEFPTISIHESFSAPTSMYLRNLMSMDTEEMIRAQPMDAVVMIGGCDKTVPAQLMGAASAGIAAGRDCRPYPRRGGNGCARRGDGSPAADHRQGPDARRLRERHARSSGHWWLDQRHHSVGSGCQFDGA